MLSDVLERDGQQLSALQTQQQALSNADHLAILHAIWTAETSPAREQRYKKLLMDALPPGYRQEPSHQARWLWRTMRAAELAGLDPGQALAAAIGERPLTGARDVPSVIDARLRHRVGPLVPLPLGPWSEQVPDIADPERQAFVAQIADMMDARKVRIGEHAAENALPWAVNALGPVPDHPLDRLEWQRRASSIGAYRELSGHDHPTEPIGPEPTAGDRDKRPPGTRPSARPRRRPRCPRPAGRASCCTCATPIPSKPPGRRSGSATSSARSLGAQEARWQPSGRGRSKGAAATRRRTDGRPAAILAASYRAMHDAYREREAFATTMADRADWEQAGSNASWPSPPTRTARRHRPAVRPRCAQPKPEPGTQAQRDEHS